MEYTLQDFKTIPFKEALKIGVDACLGFSKLSKLMRPSYRITEEMIGVARGKTKVWVSRDISKDQPDGPLLRAGLEELEEQQALSILEIIRRKFPPGGKYQRFERVVGAMKSPVSLAEVAEQLAAV